MKKWLVIGAVVVVGALLALILIANARNDDGELVSDKLEPASDNTAGTSEKGVVLIEAYSLGCPACADMHGVVKQIREEYADQIVLRLIHYPLTANFQNARAGHRAVEAAARQGKFWEMHDLLFESRHLWVYNETNNSNPVPQLEVFASQLGLDMEQFRRDFRSQEINDIINRDEAYLQSLGVSSTPTFFLNDQKILNWQAELGNIEIARNTLNEVLGIDESTEPNEETDETENQGAEDNGPAASEGADETAPATSPATP